MVDRDHLIAFHQIPGVGWHTLDRIIQSGWDFERPITPSLIEAWRLLGIKPRTLERIQSEWNPAFVKQVKSEFCFRNIATITIYDEQYPPLLKEIAQPPWILYGKGSVSLLLENSIGIVGTRKPTPYGRRATQYLTERLVEAGWCVVSGMANGIDGLAHQASLKVGGKTIAVLGTGVDVVYPKNHRPLYEEMVQKGVVISEMPPGTKPHPGLFPQRNRIISGLSLGIVVVEAAQRSGSLITADYAMEQGREVFAVPGSIFSEQSQGTLHLIQQGAKCVQHEKDILEEFHWVKWSEEKGRYESIETIVGSEIEIKILEFLQNDLPVRISDLLEKLSQSHPVEKIHPALLKLEMKQMIVQLPGGVYVRK